MKDYKKMECLMLSFVDRETDIHINSSDFRHILTFFLIQSQIKDESISIIV